MLREMINRRISAAFEALGKPILPEALSPSIFKNSANVRKDDAVAYMEWIEAAVDLVPRGKQGGRRKEPAS